MTQHAISRRESRQGEDLGTNEAAADEGGAAALGGTRGGRGLDPEKK